MDHRDSDTSLPIAILALATFFVVAFYVQQKDQALNAIQALKAQYELRPAFWTTFVSAVGVNFLWILGILTRRFGLTGQGARLRTLSQNAEGPKIFSRGMFWALCAGIALGIAVALGFESIEGLESIPYSKWIVATFVFQPGVFLALIYSRFKIEPLLAKIVRSMKPELPPWPENNNVFVLGSVNEESESSKEWLTSEMPALNGGVLITGSIGCGKTQGAVLPYLEQALKRLDPAPSILAIDPKRMFVDKAKQIASSLKQAARLRVLSLDGKENFNPVYVEGILKNSKFIDSAEMVRAAAINYSGRSVDSPFWEISSFNLMKNAIVYCAAVKGYFTLKMSTERW